MSCRLACPACDRLRTVAREIVGEDGIDAVSTGRLSRRARLPRSVITKHYPSADACLYATYDELSFGVFLEIAGAFADATSWQAGFELAQRRLVRRMAANLGEARLCYGETMRARRELRRRRDVTRQWIVDFLAAELARRHEGDRFSVVQIELLVGATSREMAAAVAAGELDDPVLEAKLVELTSVFNPVGV